MPPSDATSQWPRPDRVAAMPTIGRFRLGPAGAAMGPRSISGLETERFAVKSLPTAKQLAAAADDTPARFMPVARLLVALKSNDQRVPSHCTTYVCVEPEPSKENPELPTAKQLLVLEHETAPSRASYSN